MSNRVSSSSKSCPLDSICFRFDNKEFNEESFVILSKDSDNQSSDHNTRELIGITVEETKQLINIEPTKHCQKTETDLITKKNLQNDEASKMDQRVVIFELPKMPQIERRTAISGVISVTTVSTDLATKETEKKILEIIKENIHLKDIILHNNKIMKFHYKNITAWQKEILDEYQAYNDKITEHKDFSDKLEKENGNSIHELTKLREIKKQQDKELFSLKQTLKGKEPAHIYVNLFQNIDGNVKQFELNLANKKVKELQLVLQSVTSENTNLTDVKNDLIKQNNFKIDDYEKEIEKLRKLLDGNKDQVEVAKMELLKVKSMGREKQESLNKVIVSLSSHLSVKTQQGVSFEEMADIRQQLTNTKTILIQMEQRRAAAYSEIECLNNKILELRKQLYDTQSQIDDISALQIQLDVYKADFESERDSKEALEAEHEKLFEDIQNLQRHNQQLLEEIKMLQKQHVHSSDRREDPSTSSTSNRYSKKCPKCSFGFSSRQAFEIHVYRCFELYDPFS